MNKSLIVSTLLIGFLVVTGSLLVRSLLTNTINRRLDSSEAVMINEIDSRLYRDFHQPEAPIVLEVTPTSFQYTVQGETVYLESGNKDIKVTIQYNDGTTWTGQARGSVKVQEVDKVQIEDRVVDLKNTHARVYALSYRFVDNPQAKRVTLNRNYTRYLAVQQD